MFKNLISIIIFIIIFSGCTKSTESKESINTKINNCIDQKINDGWETSRAESFCDNHY